MDKKLLYTSRTGASMVLCRTATRCTATCSTNWLKSFWGPPEQAQVTLVVEAVAHLYTRAPQPHRRLKTAGPMYTPILHESWCLLRGFKRARSCMMHIFLRDRPVLRQLLQGINHDHLNADSDPDTSPWLFHSCDSADHQSDRRLLPGR